MVRVRAKDRVRVEMLFRVRVWSFQSVQWRGTGRNFHIIVQ